MSFMMRGGELYVRQMRDGHQSRNRAVLQLMHRMWLKFGKSLPDADWVVDTSDGDVIDNEYNHGVW